jgi:S1-C subfamily serine protease
LSPAELKIENLELHREELPMSLDYPRRQRPRGSPMSYLWPLVVVVIGAAGVGAWLWHLENAGGRQALDADAVPRPVAERGQLGADELETIRLYEKVAPSVVHISNLALGRDIFSLNVQEVTKGTGSGFVWSEDGLIVTNYHVVQDADAMRVIFPDKDRSSYETHDWMAYPDKDLAVLYIKAPKSKLHPIEVGTSHDLQIGQKAFAIGNPFGLDQTLTVGIVSALGREIESATKRPISGVIQTSAAINPGNSGGPLLDSAGHLIGVNTAILSPSGTFAGIGFAIPVDEVNRIVPKLIAALNKTKEHHGEVTSPRLGVQPAQDQQARLLGVDEGVLILNVSPGGPAAKAHLRGTRQDQETGRIRLGDVIVAVDNQPVKNLKDLYSGLEQHQPGDEVTLTIIRSGQRQDVKVTLQAVGG